MGKDAPKPDDLKPAIRQHNYDSGEFSPDNDSKFHRERAERAKSNEAQNAPAHRHCPVCWNNPAMRGLGVSYGTKQQTKRYYRCNQCNHTFCVCAPPPTQNADFFQQEDLETRAD